MSMTDILDPNNWTPLSIERQLELAKENAEGSSHKPYFWRNSPGLISPLLLYKYLKARFGPPNGFVMMLKNPSSDNLIHWQYSIQAPETIIHFWGKTSGLEISIKTQAENISEKPD